MFYRFPVIESLDEFRAKLTNPLTYREVDKGEYVVFNYNGLNPDNFPPIESEADTYIRECRGIAFHKKTGRVISRPFHKFFNYGERPETINPDLNVEHLNFIKLDGSMIHTLPLSYGVRLATKAGVTDTSMMAEKLVATDPNYQAFFNVITTDYESTAIFEYTAPENRIVVKYDRPQLSLLDIRQNYSGEYLALDIIRDVAADYNIPVVDLFSRLALNDHLVNNVKNLEEGEGIVTRFVNGHRFKIKADKYVKLHRYTDITRSDRNFVNAWLSEEWDDIIANAAPELKIKFDEAIKELNRCIDYMAGDLHTFLRRDGPHYIDPVKDRPKRGEFAMFVNTSSRLYNHEAKVAYRSFIDDYTREKAQTTIRFELINYLRSAARKEETWLKAQDYFGFDPLI